MLEKHYISIYPKGLDKNLLEIFMDYKEVIEELKKSNMYIAKKKFVNATGILDRLLKSIEPIEIDKHGKVLDFRNHLEFILYCHMDRHTKISWTRNTKSCYYSSCLFHRKAKTGNKNSW